MRLGPQTSVVLRTGDALTAAEIFEGLALLAKRDSPFPLMNSADETKAMIAVAFEALEWARDAEVL